MSDFAINQQYGTYEIDETLSSPTNGVSHVIPDHYSTLSVTLEISGGGSGKVQTSTNKISDIKAGAAGVVWVDWPDGTITATASKVCQRPSAIRVVNISGTTRLIATLNR